MFLRALSLAGIKPPAGTYKRVWPPLLTLWYLVWQALRSGRTLEQVLTDARRGGADRLVPPDKPLSKSLKSKSTAAYAKARQRLPSDWVRGCFLSLARLLHSEVGPTDQELPVQLLDGSTKRLRPYGDIPQEFRLHRTRGRRSYWCLARLLVCFCARTGIAVGAWIASTKLSEQALAVQHLLEAAQRALYIGDRNFGVWRVARAAVQGGGQILVRLTQVRARRLLGCKRLPRSLDLAVRWAPTAHDQVDPGLRSEPVEGRLIIIQAHPRGYRPFSLYLFTSLTEVAAYPPQRLLELYGLRWQVELDFRSLKSTMHLDQSETKSADMVRKEFYAGLMAYNLVRGLMAAAAQAGCAPRALSFSKVQGLLASLITELFMEWMSRPARLKRLLWLLTEASAAALPRRSKPRPNEPRAQYHKPQVYPRLQETRAQARRALKKALLKS